jgi:hypothetical protein
VAQAPPAREGARVKKIEYAVGAAGVFIRHLHRENFDRGLIATFGHDFRIEQNFTGTESQLHSALGRVARSVTNEQTRLYDSIEDIINAFWQFGQRDRPWLLTIITDGQDNQSQKYAGNPAGIGRVVATRYNHEPTNYIFVIGVGEGNQIDVKALRTLGDAGRFPTIAIEDFPLLEAVFLEIAIEVSEQTVGRHVDVGDMSWDEVERIRRVSMTPLDYAFLIDRSGSMNEPG